jgi:predicted DCC family thiol-disulfide oxidoreductase YuxK
VQVEQEQSHIKSAAVLRIAAGLANPFPLLAMFGLGVPSFLRDAAYDQIANNRYR